MAATQCIYASRCGEDDLLKFKPSIRMGKKGDLSDFERAMFVGARRAVWVFQKLLIYWDFHAQPSLEFTENGRENIKYPVSGSCVDENALLMSEVRGERADWLEMIESNSNSNNHSWQPRYSEYHLWTHNMSNPEADGLQQQKTTPGAAPVS